MSTCEVVVEGLGEVGVDLSGEYLDQEWNDIPLTPNMILTELILGVIEWPLARFRFSYLAFEPEGEWLWNMINDGCYLLEIQALIAEKINDREIGDPWVTMYRRTYRHLERIVERYAEQEPYRHYEKYFGLGMIAQDVLNEIYLEQTAPMNEARSLEVDEYTGIDDEGERDYIRVPDYVRLKNADGDMVDVSLMELKPDITWDGDLDDPDHEWYEDYRPNDHPSATIQQMQEQEYQITGEFYELLYRYKPAINELDRQITSDKLYRIANKENRTFVYEHLAEKLKGSVLVRSLEKGIREECVNYEPQDIAALVMHFPVEMSINGNIDGLIDMFGDDILDSIVDGKGMTDQPESEWEDELDAFHRATLVELDRVADNNSVRTSAEFVREVVTSIAVGGLAIREANTQAYKSWREHTSEVGSNAFRQTLDNDGSLSEAMKAFYKAAKESGDFIPRDRIVGATDGELILRTASSSYASIRHVPWGIAKLKAQKNEMYIPKSAPNTSVAWLTDKLKSLGLRDSEISQLAQ